MTGIIDTHCHYDDEVYSGETDKLFAEFENAGVEAVITCATDLGESFEKSRDLAARYGICRFAAGVHPQNIKDGGEPDISLLRSEAVCDKCVCIGEIGLDYHERDDNREEQIKYAGEQIKLANELRLPVSFHDRNAHGDTMELLRRLRPRGVVHCFSGGVEMAREVTGLGMAVGVGGVVTFSNARKLVRVVEEVPLSAMVLETDAPYLAPEPYRGRVNRSDYLAAVAQRIAEIKGVSADEVITVTSETARSIFNI